MDQTTITKFSLNFPLSENQLDLGKFNLLSETESDRLNTNSFANQINELKAQLDIVNEDRQRLKKENERLRLEKNTDVSKILATHAEIQKQIENDKFSAYQQEISKLRKICEEKDKLLNAMRNLLGGNYDFNDIIKENQENKCKIATSPGKYIKNTNSKLPGTRKALKANRSISPYTKC